MNTPLGKIIGESDEAYHALAAVSKSKLDDFIQLPALYYGRHIAKTIGHEESAAFDVGKAVHALVLEGAEAFHARFVSVPTGSPKRPTQRQIDAKKPSPETVAAVAFWEEFTAANEGKTILSDEDSAVVHACAAAVANHATAAMILRGTESEVSWRVAAGPYLLQCRTDAFGYASEELVKLLAAQGISMTVGEPYAADVKTTGKLGLADFREWKRKFVSYGYHRQGPFYQAVMKDVLGAFPERFFFIIVSKEAPYACAVVIPDDEANERGWFEVAEALDRLRKCYETNTWPALPATVQSISLPAWYGKEDVL